MALLCVDATTITVYLCYNCGKSGIPISVKLFCGINILTWCSCNIVGAKLQFNHDRISTSWTLPNELTGGSCFPLVCTELFSASYTLSLHPTPPSIHVISSERVLPLLTMVRLGFGERRFYDVLPDSDGFPPHLYNVSYTFILRELVCNIIDV